MLTHVKEKLQFVQGENTGQREKLKVVECDVSLSLIVMSVFKLSFCKTDKVT